MVRTRLELAPVRADDISFCAGTVLLSQHSVLSIAWSSQRRSSRRAAIPAYMKLVDDELAMNHPRINGRSPYREKGPVLGSSEALKKVYAANQFHWIGPSNLS